MCVSFNSITYSITITNTCAWGVFWHHYLFNSILQAIWLGFQAPFNVITYSITGNGNAPNYFQLTSPTSGLVVVRDTLTRDSALSYTVRFSFFLVCLFPPCLLHCEIQLLPSLSFPAVSYTVRFSFFLVCLFPLSPTPWDSASSCSVFSRCLLHCEIQLLLILSFPAVS